MLKRFFPLLIFSMLMASDYSLPDEATYIWLAEQLGIVSESETNIIWNVTVTDGQDTVAALNGPLQFHIDAYGVLGYNNEYNHPEIFTLFPNYPNPFNPIKSIQFDIPEEITSAITLQIYDMTGRMIDELVNEEFSRGSYSIRWNALNVSSGVYFAVLESTSNRNIQKLILLK
jgi:hypothetical protein